MTPGAHPSGNTRAVFESALQELYPPEKYPRSLFPDLYMLLHQVFTETIKNPTPSQPGFQGKENHPQNLATTIAGILDFKNLLKHHPQTVVLLYRRYIKKFIFYKHRDPDEREDILQEVITRLIEDKIYKIQEKFDFEFKNISTFSSYLMVTVRNIYIDIVRERNVRPLTAGELLPVDNLFDGTASENMMNRLLLEEELLKLRTILKMYYKSRAKIELCLKLKFRIPVKKEDTVRCFPNCSQEEVNILTGDYKKIQDNRMFEKVAGIFNRHEKKESKSDTIRKWIFVKLDEIISHLNHTHHNQVYNRKNVGELVFLYYREGQHLSPVAVSNLLFSS